MLGAVAEYARRVTAERTQDSKRRAVERGVPPFPNVPPGYQRRAEGTLEPHPREAAVVAGLHTVASERRNVSRLVGRCLPLVEPLALPPATVELRPDERVAADSRVAAQ
jgi:hypothetical protein